MERSKNIFDKIGSIIPGYMGYALRDARRNADKLLRNKISDEILKCEEHLYKRIKIKLKNNNFNLLEDLEECQKQLHTISEKVRYAVYGESSFFSESQIKENELQKIYKLDHEIMLFVIHFQKDIDEHNIPEIFSFIDSLKLMLEKRNAFIKDNK